MKPPFFVGSRLCRAQSCSGGNCSPCASFFPLHQSRNKTALKQSLTLPFFHSDETCRPSSPHFHSRNLSSSQERQPSVRSPQPASPKVPTCSRALPRVAEKWGTFCANKEAFRGNTQLFLQIAPLIPALRDFFCGMTRLLLRFLVSLPPVPSNASSPFFHRSLVTSSPLCLPSVNSLSTTIAAP